MIYHKKYEVDPTDIVEGAINWKTTGSGEYIIATYNGVKYFVKRNVSIRYPSRSIPEPAYSMLLEAAKPVEEKQEEMRKRCKGLTVDGDHIVIEEENFWDDDSRFTTVTRCIPGEIPDFDFTTLDVSTFLKLCSDMTTLIKKIHDVGITHGDLKEKNILISHNGSDLIPYLIDFDSSYPSDYSTRTKKDGTSMLSHPVVYSEGYQSPEIAIYNCEDAGVVDPATITNKTDIFTLAIIFHRLWTKTFPAVIGDTCAVGVAVYLDEKIQIDKKFDFEIGPKYGCKFSTLLMWMLQKDATKRPTADKVIDALMDNFDISDEFESAESTAKIDVTPHDVHAKAVVICDKDVLKGMNVKVFTKITDGGQYKYYVKLKDGTEERLTIDEVIAKGYGQATATSLGTLWEEDAKTVEFEDVAKISAMGILAIEPKQAGFKKFYYVAFRAGGGYTTSKAGLLDRGIAKYKVVEATTISGDTTPWPEHGSSFKTENLASRNVIKVERVVVDGDNRYKLTTKTDSGERENIVKVNYMKLMKFI